MSLKFPNINNSNIYSIKFGSHWCHLIGFLLVPTEPLLLFCSDDGAVVGPPLSHWWGTSANHATGGSLLFLAIHAGTLTWLHNAPLRSSYINMASHCPSTWQLHKYGFSCIIYWNQTQKKTFINKYIIKTLPYKGGIYKIYRLTQIHKLYRSWINTDWKSNICLLKQI